MGKKYGCNGAPRHQALVDFLGEEAPYCVAEVIGNDCFIFSTTSEDGQDAIARTIGTNAAPRPGHKGKRLGGYYPDVAWEFWPQDGGEDIAMAVEVGRLNLLRWPKHIPIIHVGFDGTVNCLNSRGDLATVMGRIGDALQETIDRNPKLWKVKQPCAS